MRVNRRIRLKEAVVRNNISQIEIGLIKGPDRANVLPVPFKNVRADVPVFDRLRDNVFAEIDQIVRQALHQDLPVENVNAHGSLVQFLSLVRTRRAE